VNQKTVKLGKFAGLFIIGLILGSLAAASGLLGTAGQQFFGIEDAEAASLFQSCVTQIELPVVWRCIYRRTLPEGVVCAELEQKRWFDCPNCWATKKGMVDCDYYSDPPCKSIPLPAKQVSCMAAGNNNPTPTRRPRQNNPTATPVPPLPAPQSTATCNPSGNQVTITWNMLAGAERYILRVDKFPFDWANMAGGDLWFEPNGTSFTLAVEPAVRYRYALQGVRSGDTYPYPGYISNWQEFTCLPPDRGEHTGASGTVRIQECRATGWAQRAERPNDSIPVEVEIDGRVVASGATNGSNSAFNIDLSGVMEPGVSKDVYVYAVGRNGRFRLDNSPRRLTCLDEPDLSLKTPPAEIVYFWNSRDLDPNTKLPEFEVAIENFYGGYLTIWLYSPYGYDPDGEHDNPDKKGLFNKYEIKADSGLFEINGTSATFKMNAESAKELEKPHNYSGCIVNTKLSCFGTTLGKSLRGTDRNKASDAIGRWTAIAQYTNEYGEKSDKVIVFWNVEGTIVGER